MEETSDYSDKFEDEVPEDLIPQKEEFKSENKTTNNKKEWAKGVIMLNQYTPPAEKTQADREQEVREKLETLGVSQKKQEPPQTTQEAVQQV